ncbi:MAG: phenylacetate-CoA oxygenase subunit PaaJ [Acidimicrobiia bacterium]|nr:MAG: phenylacetate-CoA oxygenase subunit PaaJ [Acidimicrobiia bacterium]
MDAACLPGVGLVKPAALVEAEVRSLLENVVDPDIPFLSIADIAILRDVSVAESGRVTVTITPTYSGCPAMGVITEDIGAALVDGGYRDVSVDLVYSPAWTTEWMSAEAKAKLAANRIAPPGPLGIAAEVLCPSCSSDAIRTASQFGSTACKSLMVCTTCGEPFDHFKAI